ncbi:MAG: RsmG family class I SAM-dependent methyltransferase, partial [Verrucomicrobiota bacterium]
MIAGNTPPPAFLDALETLDVPISVEQLEQLNLFHDLLEEAGDTMNLVSSGDRAHLWLRHIFDSLTLHPHLEPCETIADLGSGGGFPA